MNNESHREFWLAKLAVVYVPMYYKNKSHTTNSMKLKYSSLGLSWESCLTTVNVTVSHPSCATVRWYFQLALRHNQKQNLGFAQRTDIPTEPQESVKDFQSQSSLVLLGIASQHVCIVTSRLDPNLCGHQSPQNALRADNGSELCNANSRTQVFTPQTITDAGIQSYLGPSESTCLGVEIVNGLGFPAPQSSHAWYSSVEPEFLEMPHSDSLYISLSIVDAFIFKELFRDDKHELITCLSRNMD
ncbi:hypothetical protein C8J55DRAFT_548310 [Lentinula edodes]|uniref:Uncharacterized protein n=1 Tax=Lentinula lateritia TaxID=40482 RepID=A0A9W9ALL8_9AGAR|nr:hypothetical protein C8J55DRAFT_548310 [Lentinula edodes]